MLTKEQKKQYDLPIRKEIRYIDPKGIEHPVYDVSIFKVYNEWAELEIEIEIERGERFLIHSAFLAHMQKPTFRQDIAIQKKRQGLNEWYEW